MDEAEPDPSSLTTFSQRIEENGGKTVPEEQLRDAILMAMDGGVEFGKLRIVDSTPTVADVSVSRDDHRNREGKLRHHGDARWGVRKTEKRKDRSEPNYFYAYKTYAARNAKAEMITSLEVTGGNADDGKQFPRLVEKDE